MKELLLDLHNYNCWANTRLARAFAQNAGKLPERSLMLFSHVLNAHLIWLARLRKEEAPYKVFQVHDVQTIQSVIDRCANTLLALLDSLPEDALSATYTYTNTQGKTYTNTALQILTHVITHSAYHRAQVATDMRQNGLEPVNTDYITYARELNGED